MHPVEHYLTSIAQIYRTGGGTAEESYYGALETLLNEVGRGLKPAVRCVAQLKNTGAGEPDFGLYTSAQFQRLKDEKPAPGALPERGVIECKPFDDDSFAQSHSAQVSKYWSKYSLVLVTNYHDFVLVGRDEQGKPLRLETFRLAGSHGAFLDLLAHPKKSAAQRGGRFVEFLGRALRCNAPLTDPEDLAQFLASYAREARLRVEDCADLPALAALKRALEQALGMTFEGEKGEHFFRATLVQTLFYGVFSSWVLWARGGPAPGERFNWREAGWTLHVPMIKSLFEQIATPTRLKKLDVDQTLDWAGAALDRVDRAAFFARFEEHHAVQYFYEPFLKAYDPELRKELGVWYTPPEIVQYQVERVDRVLREELGLTDGLASPEVVVLDPCCGTGAYLVETLRRIHATLEGQGLGALTAQRLKKAAMERVFGFELLPAPFVVAHLQIGLMLGQLGAPLDHGTDQRAGVYLTNALTGWEPPKKPKDELPLFPELMEERDAANRVKQKAPILVILGNPPYNRFAGTSPEEEGDLVELYKEGLNRPVAEGGWGIKSFNMDDLYVRFFRIAERRIAKSGKGVVCYISNFSYLGDPSFVVMRQRFLAEFDKLWFDCLNGDSRETGKLTPEGKPDPSVFSSCQSPVGIRVGTAIGLMVRKEQRAKKPAVRFQHYWGAAKREDLLASLKQKGFDRKYETANPMAENRYSFRPSHVSGAYVGWPTMQEMTENSAPIGILETRGGGLFDADIDTLKDRMRKYFDPNISWDWLVKIGHGLTNPVHGFIPSDFRRNLLKLQSYSDEHVRPYLLRPFDKRYCYFPIPHVSNLWKRSSPPFTSQCWKGNSFLVSRPVGKSSPEGIPFYYTTFLGEQDAISGHAYYFPIRLRHVPEVPKQKGGMDDMFAHEQAGPEITANLSAKAREYLVALGIKNPDKDAPSAGLIWMHALAIGYSPAYLTENADGIRQDWPRIPLPEAKKALLASAALGERVAALLDVERPVPGVTCGKIDPALAALGIIHKAGGGALDPGAGELDVTAGWGHGGKDGVCMPGRGRTEPRTLSEAWIKKHHWPQAFGPAALDVYLNDSAYWASVPQCVWDYTIGGYQVIKKWLSYRERAMLGRGLTPEEAAYVTEMIRRLGALVLMQSELDANYQSVKAATWTWTR